SPSPRFQCVTPARFGAADALSEFQVSALWDGDSLVKDPGRLQQLLMAAFSPRRAGGLHLEYNPDTGRVETRHLGRTLGVPVPSPEIGRAIVEASQNDRFNLLPASLLFRY